VFYEFGKSLSALCPHALDGAARAANQFFMSGFQEFIGYFPNLRLTDDSFASQKILTGSDGSTKTFLAFVRVHARNGFRREFHAQSKK